ncbi:MAG: cysteine--tRNA ligase [Patescibacteria group bacterium]
MTHILKLYNTLTKQVEEFKPIVPNKVGMYHCGPTVYDYPHIGNLRSYIFADTLRRTCEFLNYKVDQVINITDVGHIVSDADTGEDKIEKAAKKEGKTAKEISGYFTNIFMENLRDLNINTAGTHFPKATEYIPEQIELIQKLEAAGHTYQTSEGIYFDVATYAEYGKLGNIDLKGLEAGIRVAISDEKHTPYDFALWKFSPADGAQRQQEWDSPWGIGYPGWHIECSAMSQKILGETFDIHTGGIDHIPVHHNNEIAQSESLSHKPLANIWMHGAFLNWKDRKMSKSDGSFVKLSDLTEKGISPLGFRYFLLQSKYRQEVVFDIESLQAAQTAYTRLLGRIKTLWQGLDDTTDNATLLVLINGLEARITDDLNAPQVLAFLWDSLKYEGTVMHLSKKDLETFITLADSLLGLRLVDSLKEDIIKEIPDNIKKLFDARLIARTEKNWTEADRLREEIKAAGYEVID